MRCVVHSRADYVGLVVAEAMACGTPVLAAGMGGVAEQVSATYDGYVFAPRITAEQLPSRIAELLHQEGLATVGVNAARWVGARYSSERMARACSDLYRDLLPFRRSDQPPYPVQVWEPWHWRS